MHQVARYFNLTNHSKQLMAVCDLSLLQGSTKIFLKSAPLIFTVSTRTYAFHSPNLFCCSSLAMHQPMVQFHLSVFKPHTTHNSSIRYDEGLTLETSASESLYGGQSTLSTQLIKPNYLIAKTLKALLSKGSFHPRRRKVNDL